MSLKQLVIVAGNRISSRLWSECMRLGLVRYDDADILGEITVGVPWETFWNTFRAEFPSRFFYSPRNRKDFFVQTLQSLHAYEDILDDANAAASRTFDLLGSGPVTLARPIAWNTDFITGAAWQEYLYTKTVRSNDIAGGDIKVPWELGRFHYLVWLGKGYWVSNSRRYADAFRDLVTEWIDANAMPYGIQWDNAMEVALRACNWIAGMAFFLDEPTIDAAFWQRMLVALWKHAEFIEDNLEITRRSGNHLITDYCGLVFIGALFHHTVEGERWMAEGVRGMEQELMRQTSDDGVNYEKSIAYHRFVTEMALATMLLCRHMRLPFRDDVARRIERMCEFTMQYTRGDGSVPNVGDNDNGRVFRVRSTENFLDHSALLSTAAVAFERPDFKAAARAFAEETLWLCGGAGLEKFLALDTHRMLPSHAFSAGGFYVMRSGMLHCFVDAGELGKQGWGGHGHNDTLSFELWCGEPMIVDSGTCCYTADRAMRDRFRGTAAHNTAMIDGVEIAAFKNAFKIVADHTHPSAHLWRSTAERDELHTAHFAYTRLADPVTHERRFALDKIAHSLAITDVFTCKRQHSVLLSLHLAPGLAVDAQHDGTISIRGTNAALTISSSHAWAIEPCLISPSYGVTIASQRLVCRIDISGDTTINTLITV